MGPATIRLIRDPRFDEAAKRSLFRLAARMGESRLIAAWLRNAVFSGELGGIYRESERVPAQFALRLGTTWWKLIPPGEDVALVADSRVPAGAGPAPLIVFRDALARDPARLDAAMLRAWALVLARRARRGPRPRPRIPAASR
jgi:hypothetical protein